MKFILNLEPDLYQEASNLAASDGVSIGEFILEAIQNQIDEINDLENLYNSLH